MAGPPDLAALPEVPSNRLEPAPEGSAQLAVDLGPWREGRAAAAARVELARAVAAPRWWRCDASQEQEKKTARGRQRLKAWNLAQAQQVEASLLERLPELERQRWEELRWLYVQKGVCWPERLILGSAVQVEFFGQGLRTHPEVARRLLRTQAALGVLEPAPFAWAGSLSPRVVRGPFKRQPWRLSNHALGRAVDLDPARNPYLSTRELALIQKITGVKIRRAATHSAALRWDMFRRASDLWQVRASELLQEAQRLEASPRRLNPRERRTLRTAQQIRASRNLMNAVDHGFLALPRDFVIQMEREGLTWATGFRAGADLMHFEWRP